MTTIQLAILVPLVAGLLWTGLGALVSRLAYLGVDGDARLPRALWPIVGFAASIVLANSISRLGIVLPFNAIIIVALAAGGLWLERRNLVPTPGQAGLAAVAAGPALVAFCGALILAGPTLTGYLVDTNTGVHSLGADFLLHHGGDYASIPRTSTDAAMITQFFVDASYPSGAHALYGLLGALTGASLTFLATPLTGVCLAVTGLTAFAAARRLEVPPLLAALAGFVISCGALVFAFGLTSELKETVTLPLLAGMTAFALDPKGLREPRAAIVVSAVLGAALYSAIGVSSAAWAAPFAVFVIARSQLFGEARSIPGAAVSVVLTVVLGLVLIGPLLPGLANQINLAKALSETNVSLAADPGNLFGPIGKVQALGTWIGPDHRFGPKEFTLTYGLLGITWLLIAAGTLGTLRERRWSAALWLGGLFVLWYVLTARGTLWLDSKLVMLSTLPMLLLAVKGAATLAERREEPRLQSALGVALLAPVLLGVVLSAYALYDSTSTAPHDKYAELKAIDDDYRDRGLGPVYFTEFDEYAMYTLRHVHMTGVGFADGLPHPPARDDDGFAYGDSIDPDRVDPAYVAGFKLAVVLRSPQRSMPGSDWTLIREGRYFDLYQRDPAKTAKVARHIPFGDGGAALGIASCPAVEKAADEARRLGGQLVARVGAGQTVTAALRPGMFTPNWQASWGGSSSFSGPGRLIVPVPAAARGKDQLLTLIGSVGRPLIVRAGVDNTGEGNRTIGRFERLAGGRGNVVGPIRVPAGTRYLELTAASPELRPGNKSPTALFGFTFSALTAPKVETVAPADSRSLCGKPLDWIDVTRR